MNANEYQQLAMRTNDGNATYRLSNVVDNSLDDPCIDVGGILNGCLGLSGFFSNKKNGLYIGYIVAIIGRFICSFLSGFLFFGEYAPEGMNPVWYSFLYNIFYIGGEGVLTLLVLALPPVKNTIFRLKKERFQ